MGTVQTVFIQQYFKVVLTTGLRIRTAVVGIIYRKVKRTSRLFLSLIYYIIISSHHKQANGCCANLGFSPQVYNKIAASAIW